MPSRFEKWTMIGILVWGSALAASTPLPAGPPSIGSLLKPEVLQRVISSREIMTHASLGDADGNGGRHYAYYAAMLVHASVRQTRAVLTNYALYSKMISYIDKATYDPATRLLEVSGGIFGYKLHSWIQFEQLGDDWIHYRIVRGHFTGMTGDILFERREQPGHPMDTLVYMGGGLTQANWPPKLVIERGAEIVFGFTAKRMRSYITKETSTAYDQASGSGSHF